MMFATIGDIKSPPNMTTYTADSITDYSIEAVCHCLVMHYANQQDVTTTPSTNSYTLNKGLKRFGDLGKAAVTKELKQFNILITFTPTQASSLTPNQKK